MDKVEIQELIRLLQRLGEDTEVSEEEAKPYLPNIDSVRDFYIPKPMSYDWKALRRLTTL